jgi:hypothetical protein
LTASKDYKSGRIEKPIEAVKITTEGTSVLFNDIVSSIDTVNKYLYGITYDKCETYIF